VTTHERLSRLEAVVLGLLADAPAHGYALRSRLTPGLPRERQVKDGVLYPLLARLERRGLVAREEPAPEAGRTRHVYACTESGEEAFLAWLRSGRDEPQGVDAGFVLDHPFLKLLFASRLTAEERAAKLDRTEEVARERLASLDRLDDGARGTVGAVLLDVGRRREEAVLEAVARLRAGG